jgi:dipeptidyl aminopeptidase/acylaminoacyl peptidase
MSRLFLDLFSAALLTLCAACGYQQEEVTFSSASARLSGTLYLPSGKGPHPALIFVHGSGSDSREQYRFYGDIFARRGVAVLVYDKRGVGSSTGDWRRSPFSTLIDDTLAGVSFLRGHHAIDGTKVGVWGGSEGAIVAASAASRDPGIAFVVMQSATGVTFAEQNLHQTTLQMRALSLPPGRSGGSRRLSETEARVRSHRT